MADAYKRLLQELRKILLAASKGELLDVFMCRGELVERYERRVLDGCLREHRLYPRALLLDREKADLASGNLLTYLQARAVVECASRMAGNLVGGRDIDAFPETTEGFFAVEATFFETPFAWMDGSPKLPFAQEVDAALAAVIMAGWRCADMKSMRRTAAKRLDIVRGELHRPEWVGPAGTAATIVVSMPKPSLCGPTYYVASATCRETAVDDLESLRDVALVDTEFGDVPRGQWLAYTRQKDAVFEALAAARDMEPARVVFCGHGLGGTVSRLLALGWAKLHAGGPKPRVVTFGAPRGGGAAFTAHVARELHVTALRGRTDPMPSWPCHLPPTPADETWLVSWPTYVNWAEGREMYEPNAAYVDVERLDADETLRWEKLGEALGTPNYRPSRANDTRYYAAAMVRLYEHLQRAADSS